MGSTCSICYLEVMRLYRKVCHAVDAWRHKNDLGVCQACGIVRTSSSVACRVVVFVCILQKIRGYCWLPERCTCLVSCKLVVFLRQADPSTRGVLLSVCVLECDQVQQEPPTRTGSRDRRSDWDRNKERKKGRMNEWRKEGRKERKIERNKGR